MQTPVEAKNNIEQQLQGQDFPEINEKVEENWDTQTNITMASTEPYAELNAKLITENVKLELIRRQQEKENSALKAQLEEVQQAKIAAEELASKKTAELEAKRQQTEAALKVEIAKRLEADKQVEKSFGFTACC